MKYCETEIVFREFPDEITLAINISNCPHRCKGCHSPHLQTDCGKELDENALKELIEHKKDQITCIGFMGGDADISRLSELMVYVRVNWPRLNIGWYSGYASLEDLRKNDKSLAYPLMWIEKCLDYVKIGPYVEELGPLDSPTTNQRMFKRVVDEWKEIKLHK